MRIWHSEYRNESSVKSQLNQKFQSTKLKIAMNNTNSNPFNYL